jgi:glutamate-1-semialdehyde 2,1-aminomutase
VSQRNEISIPHRLIPGGAHTYSKGDDQFPENAPRFLERGDGAWVWDDEDNRFLDWTMGLRSMTLGYGYKPVDDAAINQIKKGSNFGRPSRIEYELAQDIVDMIPCAEMVKYAKHGSVVTTAAIKLARAYTGRNYVAFCKDHPFYSYDDWFIGTTAVNAGIPKEHYQYSLPFSYNDIVSLENLFSEYDGKIAAVILEPCTTDEPRDGFLERVRELCTRNGTVMIFDEMITGFRWNNGGAQAHFNVTPDLATFGKGMANGYSVSALTGRRDIMELGGILHDKPRVFLISTTHGSENHCLAAARAALHAYQTLPVIDHIWTIGRTLMDGMNKIANELGIGDYFSVTGFPCRPELICRGLDKTPSLPMRTLLLQELLRHNILLSYIVPSYAHTEEHVSETLAAAEKALGVYAEAVEFGWEKFLNGSSVLPVFRPFN